ncbi:MAG: cytochrome-c peroxidase [Myxococcota bacterium]|nr:cytochrome-c peroxidase [Myxococcota bacterium]
MKSRTLVFVLAGAAGLGLGACKKEKTTDPAPGSAGSATSEAPKVRPSQQPQPQLPELELADDPRRAEKVALGHVLFFDKRLSGHNDRSCYSCHRNEDGNGGKDPLAIGSGDKQLTRHSPVIWNVGYWKNAFYWDGRAKTLEANVKGAWSLGNMGAGGDLPEQIDAKLEKQTAALLKVAGYKPLFEAAFPGTTPKAEHVTSAIAEYMRTLVCKDTAYDKYAAGDKAALSEPQQRGLDVFQGKGKCITCHAPPFFSTAMPVEGGAYFNVGIGTKDVPEDQVDIGRMKVTNQPTDWAAFKPPSLRHITRSAPYFHDGSVATLEDAVLLMSSGGIPNKNKSPLLEDTKLSDAERADLIAFLGGLECPGALEEPKLP